ncbi:hypothetical protein CLV70_11013 [Pseudosporangium ferrugineum]|uniref:Uncharacterized protein n=1 Tax=Pseudosporangium ferrugineum TaxID=439699 RepID=A0A2T0S1Z4_9ACTN|nr:hypothetical protein CLV70_11013 [Pseudosporangium ferrugineum]
MLLLLDVLCLAGVLWCAWLIAGLLRGEAPLATGVAVPVAAALVLPGFIAGIVTNRRALRGRRPQSWFIREVWAPPVELPRWALAAAGVAVLAFWVAGISAFAGISENPRPGDQAQDRQVRHEQRFALGVLGGVGVGGTATAAATLIRDRRSRSPY